MQPYTGAILDAGTTTEWITLLEFDYEYSSQKFVNTMSSQTDIEDTMSPQPNYGDTISPRPSFEDIMLPRSNFEFTDYNQRIVISVLICIIFIVGVIGNTLVLIAVAMSRKLQTATNAFVASLAMTDLLTCLVLPFQMTGVLSTSGWVLPFFLCTIIGGIAISSAIASVITLALIAINRYVIITLDRTRYARIFSTRNVGMMILFAWFFPLVTMVFPQAIGYGRLGYTKKYKLCLMDGDHYYAFLYEFGAAAIQLTCFVVIIVCYGLIYRFLRRKMFVFQRPSAKVYYNDGNSNRVIGPLIPTDGNVVEAVECNFSDNSSVEHSHEDATTTHSTLSGSGATPKRKRKMPTRREVQITRNLFYVVCAFFICIIPYALTIPVPNSGPVLVYLAVLVIGSSVINPIIYGFNHPHFRIVFRALLRWDLTKIPQPTALVRFLRGKT